MVAVLGLFLALFAAMVINVGNLATNKIEMQGAADAAALTAATWEARGLNTVSMMNVTMTHILALIAVLESLDEMLTVTEFGIQLQIAVGNGLIATMTPPSVAAGTAMVAMATALQGSMTLLHSAVDVLKTLIEPLWQMMKILAKGQEVMARVTPGIALTHAMAVAASNGADQFPQVILFPPVGTELGQEGAFFTLPVTKDGGFAQLCDKTRNGGYGYLLEYNHKPVTADGAGYLMVYKDKLAIFWKILGLGSFMAPAFSWETVLINKLNSICGDAPVSGYDKYNVTVNSCNLCSGKEKSATHCQYTSARDFKCSQYFRGKKNKNDIITESPALTAMGDSCGSKSNLNKCDSMGNMGSAPYYPDPNDMTASSDYEVVYFFKECKMDILCSGSGASSPSDKPKPLVLKTSPEGGAPFFENHLDISAFALGSKEKIKPLMMEKTFTDPVSHKKIEMFTDAGMASEISSLYTFGQARVFNPTSYDLFTQDWKSTLTAFDMMERYGSELQNMPLTRPFAKKARALVAH